MRRKQEASMSRDFQKLAKSGLMDKGKLARLQQARTAAWQQALALSDAHTQARAALSQRLKVMEFAARSIAGFFPTPATLATEMVNRAYVTAGMRVLEPSAGAGHIATAARDAGASVKCVELNYDLYHFLLAQGFDVEQADFLWWYADRQYDAVLMNPPFDDGKDALHTMKAFQLLRRGGMLVGVVSEGLAFRADAGAQKFRAFVEAHGEWEPLPERTFMASERPTAVKARLVQLWK
jgi:hypothetical protein